MRTFCLLGSPRHAARGECAPCLTLPPATPALDRQHFRSALGMFTRQRHHHHGAGPEQTLVGLTNSFNSVSLTPPLVLWTCRAWRARCQCSRRARTTRSTSSPPSRCRWRSVTTRDIDRFAGVAWREGAGGARCWRARRRCSRVRQPQPVIPEATTSSSSARWAVQRARRGPPLIFHGGRFTSPSCRSVDG